MDRARHVVLEAAHPSPHSAKKFWGCKVFSKCNAALEAQGAGPPIDWRETA